MKPTVERNHIAAPRIGSRKLNGILHRFRTRCHKSRFLFARNGRHRIQLFAHFNERRIRHNHSASVRDFFKLFINPLHHQRVAVAGVHHCDAATKIDITIALNIPDFGILSLCRHHGSTHADAA